MRYVDIRKKRKSKWPWLLGAVVLGLALWGITILLRPPAEPPAPEVREAAIDTLPPSPIPSVSGGGAADDGTPRLIDLAPLGAEHAGRAVRLRGEVVATGNDRYWIVADSLVVRVDSRRALRKNDTVTIRGTLREADGEATERMAAEVLSRHPSFDRWTVIRPLRLVEDEGTGGSGAVAADTVPTDSA